MPAQPPLASGNYLDRSVRLAGVSLFHPRREMRGCSTLWGSHSTGPHTGAELTDFGAVLTNTTLLVAFVHMITAAFLTAGVFSAGSWSCRCPQM